MRRLIVLLLIFLVAAAVPAAQAKPTHVDTPKQLIPVFQPIVATYDVYVGGIHLITADVLFQEQGGKYRSHVEGHTYGIWHRMLPWDTDLKSQGAIKIDHFVPTVFETHDTFGKKVKMTKLLFEKDGDIKAEYDPPNHDQNREAVTLEQKRGALDPITALLQMLAYLAVEKNCNVTVPVFDGKRRFDITAKDGGFEDIDEEDYGVFKGTARTCSATFTSIAGEWKEQERDKFWKRAANEKTRDPFHIWLGTISPDLPEMPVKLDTGSVWGLIIMHMTKWHYATPEELKP